MNKLLAFACAMAVFALASAAQGADSLRHVVCFKFKSTAAQADIKKIENEFRDLKKKIAEVKSFEWGTNVSKEQRDKGFTHCFVITFKTEKDRDAYIVHPAHKDFVGVVGPSLDDVFVIDFWAKD